MSKVTLRYHNKVYPPGTELTVAGIMVKNMEEVEYETDDHPNVDFEKLQASFDRMTQVKEQNPPEETTPTTTEQESEGGEE